MSATPKANHDAEEEVRRLALAVLTLMRQIARLCLEKAPALDRLALLQQTAEKVAEDVAHVSGQPRR
ncbi:hypothetical protein M2351_006978 [Azospirillum canadense]|nr:hypothetical protein [Azospirillum canadense]